MNSILELIDRKYELFKQDVEKYDIELTYIVKHSSFLVLGGAGSIGQAVVKEIFKRNPKKLHVVDISENNMVELVRDIRSSEGYIDGNFETFSLDIGSIEYDVFIDSDGQYDYVLNLSALKHVRSEKDPFTLMRMIDVNVRNTDKTISQSIKYGVKKYFCVSTDKATNPVNIMGASKRIMEMYLTRKSTQIDISTARFANVAFSDGSLLHSFNQRIQKQQPIVAPVDIQRYFITPKESGELCLMSCIFGQNREIFFPKLHEELHLIPFSKIATRFLDGLGFRARVCETEEEARQLIASLPKKGEWPCLFSESDTTGEKCFEEFFTDKEEIDFSLFKNIGVIKNNPNYDEKKLAFFDDEIQRMRLNKHWTKKQILELFKKTLPEFSHKDTGKYLESKM
jgi:FlaA1/EpsC-like NDP-sugar epimerase